MTNGAYGCRSRLGHRLDNDVVVMGGNWIHTLQKRGYGDGFYSSYGSKTYHVHHRYHAYMRNERG